MLNYKMMFIQGVESKYIQEPQYSLEDKAFQAKQQVEFQKTQLKRRHRCGNEYQVCTRGKGLTTPKPLAFAFDLIQLKSSAPEIKVA